MTITAIAAPIALPIMRIAPRDSETAKEDRVTIQAEIAAHQGSSECNRGAAKTARDTDIAAARAAVPRGPRASSERNSVRSAPAIPRNIAGFLVKNHRARVGAHMESDVRALILQDQGHWKAPLETNPVRRRRHI